MVYVKLMPSTEQNSVFFYNFFYNDKKQVIKTACDMVASEEPKWCELKIMNSFSVGCYEEKSLKRMLKALILS